MSLCCLSDAQRALVLLEEYRARLQRAEDRQLQHSIQRVIDIFQSSLFQALIGTYAPETASCMRLSVCPDRKLLCPRCLLTDLFAMEDVFPLACCAPPAARSAVSAAVGYRPLVPQDGPLAAVLTVAVHFLQQGLPVHAGTGSCDDLVDQSYVGKRSPRRRMPPLPLRPQKPQRLVQWVELSVIPVWTRRLPRCVIPPPSSRVPQATLFSFRQIVSTSGMDCGTGLGSYGVQSQLPLSPLGASGWEPLPTHRSSEFVAVWGLGCGY